jgi:predicted Zn-dependent peptidase
MMVEPGPEAVLIVDPMPMATGAALGIWFPTGSAHESDSERGLSHFVEHMVFKGAGDLGAEELSRVIDRVGGYLNAFTERETVCLHSLVPGPSAIMAATILLDMVFKPKFKLSEFECEKNVIINEIMSAEDDLEESGQDEFYAMTYGDHAMGRRIAGSVEDVRSATLPGLQSYHQQRYAEGPMIMTAAGAVDPDVLCALFERSLASRRVARQVPVDVQTGHDPSTSILPVFRRTRRMIQADGSQVHLFSGQELPPSSNVDDFWRLSIASSAYGESMSSRLFMRLREQQGLCYSISSSFYLSPLAGIWGVSSSTSPKQLRRFCEAYVKEAESFNKAGLDPLEIAEARSRLQGMLALAGDDPEFRMKRLARQYLYTKHIESLNESVERLGSGGSIDDQSINTYIVQILGTSSENILFYGHLNKNIERTGRAVFGAEIAQGVLYD